MPKNDIDWHVQDIKDELEELKEAEGLVYKWSEISDVVYTYTRAKWSGHKELDFPLKKIHFYVGLVYMFPKYTLRWKFFRKIGKSFDKDLNITEVRNPKKINKLENIADKYNLDKDIFKERSEKLLKRWVLLK
jgi:hypothetical protein